MRQFRRKLNSERGATMMMALLLLALTVMVSAVIISAALTNAKHLRSERTQEQAFLTVSSAAELLLEALEGQKYVAVLEKTDVTEQHIQNEETGETEDVFYEGTWSKTLPRSETLGAFGSLLCGRISELGYTGAATGDASAVEFRISVEGLQDVLVTFRMHKDYGITAQLALDPDGGDGRCRMYLTLRGDFTDSGVSYSDVISDDGQTSTRTSTQTYTIRWINPKIEKGAAPE